MGNSSSSEDKTLYRRYKDELRGKPISDEDIQKYTGKSRAELDQWAEHEAGVGKNQRAGGIAQGPASGLGGVAAGDGYGGWGMGAAPNDGKRGLKFPPQKPKELEDSDCSSG